MVFVARPGHNQLVTAGRNLLLRLWDLETFTCLRTIKAHDTPVLAMDFDPTGTLLATGGSDRTVKVFDVDKGFCTHNFRGHAGIVTLVKFHADPKRLQLVSSSDDSTVRIWDLYTQEQFACIQDHMSPATCVAFSRDGYTLLTAGRDKVVNFWDMRSNKLAKTVLVHEAVEGLQVIPNDFSCVKPEAKTGGKKKSKKNEPVEESEEDKKVICFVTAGEKGLLRVWRSSGASCEAVLTQAPESDTLKYLALLLNEPKRELVAVSADQNLLVFNEKLARTTQIIGYNDDILNLKYIPSPDGTSVSKQIAVATNSEQIRLLNRETLSCELLSGHSDIVMSLAVSPDGKWLVSASKDRTARVWSVAERRCVATCSGHTEALGAVAISQKIANFSMGSAFFVSGSSDKTLKMWSLKSLSASYAGGKKHESKSVTVTTLAAVRAHDKDVNALAVSPNDRLIASASQDKLIKVWHAQTSNGASLLALAGTCRGHKRGVWAVEFSPVDQCLASASGDKTVKIWSVKDFSCLKTFEGHTASVLGVQFVCAGMQLVSAGADGLLKLWTIKSNECEATFDQHEDKVWALSVAKDGSEMVSGGADSTIHLWRDFTEEEEMALQKTTEDKVLKEQQLFNCLRNDKLLDAVQIAFELGHPHRLLQILNDLMEGPRHKDRPDQAKGETFAVEDVFAPVIQSLADSDEQLKTLLEWVKEWNTNARHSAVCQALLASMLRELPPSRLQKIDDIARTVEALIAYSERHLQRVDRMLQKSYLVDFSIVSMKNLLPVAVNASDSPVTDATESDSDDEVVEEEEPVEEKPATKAAKRPSGKGAAAAKKKTKKQRV